MKKLLTSLVPLFALAFVFVPVFAFANSTVDTEGLQALAEDITGILNTVIGLMTALAIVFFIYGLIRFIFIQDAGGKASARSYMIYSVIAFAVLSGLWALSNFLLDFFGLDTNRDVSLPGVIINND